MGSGRLEEAAILHVNVTDFMAAVEEVRDPSLRGRPFVVGWQGRSRAIVLAVSETAFREGIRKGMRLDVARRKVRTLEVLSPSYDVYRRADARLVEVAGRFSPLVESKGSGHVYLDLTGTRRLFGPPVDCAERIRKEIVEGTDLLPSLGLSAARVVSKVGTRVARPSGFVAVPPGSERSFLAPLDVSLLPGVGGRLLARLNLLQVRTIGDLASLSEEEAEVLGPFGPVLRNRALGRDARMDSFFPRRGGGRLPEQAAPEEGTLSADITLPEDMNDPRLLLQALRSLLFELGFTLRTRGLSAGSLRVQLTYTDGLQSQATRRFPSPVHADFDMVRAANALLPRVLQRRVRVRRIRCDLGDLVPGTGQMDLFRSRWQGDRSSRRLPAFLPPRLPDAEGLPDPEMEAFCGAKVQALEESLDRIRNRFGKGVIRLCSDLVFPCTSLS
ncbi:MAG: DNA polymerase IV [Spirochaetales bacterium]